jgi:hypothetical protein
MSAEANTSFMPLPTYLPRSKAARAVICRQTAQTDKEHGSLFTAFSRRTAGDGRYAARNAANALFVDQKLSLAQRTSRDELKTRTIVGRGPPGFHAAIVCENRRRLDGGLRMPRPAS